MVKHLFSLGHLKKKKIIADEEFSAQLPLVELGIFEDKNIF